MLQTMKSVFTCFQRDRHGDRYNNNKTMSLRCALTVEEDVQEDVHAEHAVPHAYPERPGHGTSAELAHSKRAAA